jgi:hypothetical protein
MSVKNCGVFEELSELPVVSTSSTTDPLPELVEGTSGDFFSFFPLVVAKERT